MSTEAVTYYRVTCDEEGCGTATGDLDDYSAWSDEGAALDQWLDHDGVQTPDGRTFCEAHSSPYKCTDCREAVDDAGGKCQHCQAEAGAP